MGFEASCLAGEGAFSPFNVEREMEEAAMKVLPKSLAVLAMLLSAVLPLTSATASGATTIAKCTASDVRLGVGPKVSPMTGEHSMIFTITNPKATKCQVRGYPSVALFDAKNVMLGLHYTTSQGSTSPYVTTAQPKVVVLGPGSRSYFKVAKYRCDLCDARVAHSMVITLPGVTGTKNKLKISYSALSTFTYCKGSSSGPGQLVGVSPFTSSATGTFAGAPSTKGGLVACQNYNTWPIRSVPAAVVNAVKAYYAQKKLTPITIDKNREWVVPIATQRVGEHWCLNADGSASGYVGAVPYSASAAVMLYVHHKPYPVTEAPSHFVVLALVSGQWKVVSEGTGP